MKIPRSAELFDALDRVVAAAEETDENEAFEHLVREFWDRFFAECDELGLCRDFPPDLALFWFELALIADESLPVETRADYAAAVRTIRQFIEAKQSEQATWN